MRHTRGGREGEVRNAGKQARVAEDIGKGRNQQHAWNDFRDLRRRSIEGGGQRRQLIRISIPPQLVAYKVYLHRKR